MSDPQDNLGSQTPAEALAQIQDELQSLRAELDHSHRLATLGILAAGIAHEINNILTPVLAYAQMAANNPNDAALQAKAIDRAIHGVQMASQIAQAMLGFSATGPQPDLANILECVNSALHCIGRDPAKDRIKLTLNIHPDVCVRMKPLALQQVLMNLILNASAVLRSKGGMMTISATPGRDSTTIVEVSDTGPGIPEEIAGRLFEPFAHRSTTSNRKKSGSGLGLAICRRLVEEAAGTIAAASRPGKGTKFTITLPTAQPQRAKVG